MRSAHSLGNLTPRLLADANARKYAARVPPLGTYTPREKAATRGASIMSDLPASMSSGSRPLARASAAQAWLRAVFEYRPALERSSSTSHSASAVGSGSALSSIRAERGIAFSVSKRMLFLSWPAAALAKATRSTGMPREFTRIIASFSTFFPSESVNTAPNLAKLMG